MFVTHNKYQFYPQCHELSYGEIYELYGILNATRNKNVENSQKFFFSGVRCGGDEGGFLLTIWLISPFKLTGAMQLFKWVFLGCHSFAFSFLSRTNRPISTIPVTREIWVDGLQDCSNKGTGLSAWGSNCQTLKI